ncbi:DUF3027 domain-containing protein, partial [Nocardia sp. NPDC052112]|uniref:DUF3027 domain-containing protein n=1 Tax=Nocardia sp. NPDC052112 TaxID=3155646 RepID=UPI00342C29F1
MSAVSVSQSGVRPILADAVDVARRALLELEPTGVGAHLGVTAEDEAAATHRFEASLPGYRGWQWAVVVAAPPGAQYATVSESALLPGPDALVAPDFVPWEQRIRPGDLAPGDLLAPPANDPRLVPGYVASGDPAVDDVALEIGLGRTKVLSREGREEAAERWYSEFGPETEMAKAAPSTCGRCGFYLPLAGALRSAFGVCGNAMGADGRVVHAEYGCGAHSDVEVPTGGGSPLYEAYDDAAFDVIPVAALRKPEPTPDAATEDEATATSKAVTAAEPDDRAESGAVAAEAASGLRGDVAESSSSESGVGASSGAAVESHGSVESVDVAEWTSPVESAAIPSVDVAAESNAAVAHGVSVPGVVGEPTAEAASGLTGDVAESSSVGPGVAASTAIAAESPSAVEPSAVEPSAVEPSASAASVDVAAESNTAISDDASVSGADSEPAAGVGADSTASVVESGVGPSGDVVTESISAVESSASAEVGAGSEPTAWVDAGRTASVAEPDVAASGQVAAGAHSAAESTVAAVSEGAVAEPNTTAARDATASGKDSESGDATAEATAAIAEPTVPEQGAAASGIDPVESDVAHLPGAVAAEASASGAPDVKAHGVADLSSAAATFAPAADVVAEPSVVVEPASEADDKSIGGVIPGADVAESLADSTTDASAGGEAESNGAAAENSAGVPGPESTVTASSSVPTATEPSAEVAASQPESGAEIASGVSAGSDQVVPETVLEGDKVAVESSARVAASQPESGVGAVVVEPGADVASGASAGSGEPGAEAVVGRVEGANAIVESSAEVTLTRPESSGDAAVGAVVVEPGADVASGVSAGSGEPGAEAVVGRVEGANAIVESSAEVTL